MDLSRILAYQQANMYPKVSSSTIQKGQTFYGKIEKLLTNETAIVRVGNEVINAQVNTSLEEGNSYIFEVKKVENGSIVLTIKNQVYSKEIADESIVSMNQFLLKSKVGQFLLQNNQSLSKDIYDALKPYAHSDIQVLLLQTMKKLQLPISKETITVFQQMFMNNSFSSNMQILQSEINQSKIQQLVKERLLNQLQRVIDLSSSLQSGRENISKQNQIITIQLEKLQLVLNDVKQLVQNEYFVKKTIKEMEHIFFGRKEIQPSNHSEILIDYTNSKGASKNTSQPSIFSITQQAVALMQLLEKVNQNSKNSVEKKELLNKQIEAVNEIIRVLVNYESDEKSMFDWRKLLEKSVAQPKEWMIFEKIWKELLAAGQLVGLEGNKIKETIHAISEKYSAMQSIQSLMKEQQSNSIYIPLQIPIKNNEIIQDVYVRFSGKKTKYGEIHPDFSNVFLFLEMPNLNKIGVNIVFQNNSLKVNVLSSITDIEIYAKQIQEKIHLRLLEKKYHSISWSYERFPLETLEDELIDSFIQPVNVGVDYLA